MELPELSLVDSLRSNLNQFRYPISKFIGSIVERKLSGS